MPSHPLRPLISCALLALAMLSVTGCHGSIEAKDNDQAAPKDMSSTPDQARDMKSRADDGTQDQGAAKDMVADLDASDQGKAEDMGQDQGAEDQGPDMKLPSYMSEGCVNGQGLADGEHTFMLEDRPRRYILRLPQSYDPAKAWPLVFALHGNGGNTGYWDGTSAGRNMREVLKDDAILIVAEAIDHQWRDYNLPQNTWPERIESELLYFDELITTAKRELCIDTNAIFAMGFSGGGSFSGVLGCRREDIRAIAVGGSVVYFDKASCVGKPAAWITIGTQELVAGREDFRDYWRDRAGCMSSSQPTAPSPCVAYDGCDAATPVHYCQHPAGHVWPEFGGQASWDFFKRFVSAP